MPTIFANTANPVFIPVSIFHQTMVEELRGVGGSNVKGYESKFSQNSHQYIPAQSLCFLTHYTATKNSFTLLEIVTSQEKIYGPSAHSAFGWRRCPQRDNPIPCQKTQPFRQIFETERGEGGRRGGGGGGSQKPLLAKGRDLKFCWLKFAKNFEKVFEKSYGPFLTFLPTFFELAIKVKHFWLLT